MILLYIWELFMHPLKDLKFKSFVFVLKFKKYRVRRDIHSLVLVIDKNRYGANQVANPN
jgi:hypothetical protein